MAKTNVQVIFVVGVTRWGKQSEGKRDREKERAKRYKAHHKGAGLVAGTVMEE